MFSYYFNSSILQKAIEIIHLIYVPSVVVCCGCGLRRWRRSRHMRSWQPPRHKNRQYQTSPLTSDFVLAVCRVTPGLQVLIYAVLVHTVAQKPSIPRKSTITVRDSELVSWCVLRRQSLFMRSWYTRRHKNCQYHISQSSFSSFSANIPDGYLRQLIYFQSR